MCFCVIKQKTAYECRLSLVGSEMCMRDLLWATQNLFSHPRYMNGGMTNPDVHVFCYAAAQVQKVMDINYKLGGLNHVFWGGREAVPHTHLTLLTKRIVLFSDVSLPV